MREAVLPKKLLCFSPPIKKMHLGFEYPKYICFLVIFFLSKRMQLDLSSLYLILSHTSSLKYSLFLFPYSNFDTKIKKTRCGTAYFVRAYTREYVKANQILFFFFFCVNMALRQCGFYLSACFVMWRRLCENGIFRCYVKILEDIWYKKLHIELSMGNL